MSLYHSMAIITASVFLDPENEMTYDSDTHTRSFARILPGCSELPRLLQLLTSTTTNKTPGLGAKEEKHKCEGMGFSIEMGFMLPAFFTAINCRVPRLRRRALYFIRAGLNREAGWDRRVVADMVAEVLRIEEGDFYSALSSSAYRGVTDQIEDPDPPAQKDLEVLRIEARRGGG
ncbi:hypothetical protein ZTR_00511 [Talaromyces verruculosus]|nr:hypothetical protein ZTR_00511 [Talaromyces verruculosus]